MIITIIIIHTYQTRSTRAEWPMAWPREKTIFASSKHGEGETKKFIHKQYSKYSKPYWD